MCVCVCLSFPLSFKPSFFYSESVRLLSVREQKDKRITDLLRNSDTSRTACIRVDNAQDKVKFFAKECHVEENSRTARSKFSATLLDNRDYLRL